MTKFWGSFLIGFGIALLLCSSILFLQLKPLESELAEVEPDIQSVYDLTHSKEYDSAKVAAGSLNKIFDGLSAVPILGALVNTIDTSEFIATINSLLLKSKTSSDLAVKLIRLFKSYLQLSLFGVIISIFLITGGAYIYKQEK